MMRTLCKLTLVLGVAALLAAPALAQRQRGQGGQDGGFGGPAMLLRNEGVQKELKLTDEQKEKVKTFATAQQEKAREAGRDQEKQQAVRKEGS